MYIHIELLLVRVAVVCNTIPEIFLYITPCFIDFYVSFFYKTEFDCVIIKQPI